MLAFWFAEIGDDARFARDDGLDATIRARFGALHAALAARIPDAWRTTRDGRLAAIVVLDQFSRNLYRDDARAFANDAAARRLVAEALAAGDEDALTTTQRQFLYMPLMHSEDDAEQARSVRLFADLGDPDTLAYAERHRATIARFGRFPARNAALGRASTPAEAAFLHANPDGF